MGFPERMPYYTNKTAREDSALTATTAAAAAKDAPRRRIPHDLYRYDRAAAVSPLPDMLSDADVAAYQRDGFVAFNAVLTPAEVAEARAALTDLLNGRVPGYEGVQPEHDQKPLWANATPEERADMVRKVWLFAEYEPRLAWFARSHPAIHRTLERLLGEPVRLIQDMAMLKPPHVGTEKPWHQDMAYFSWGPPEKVIGVWIALDPATAANGCMHVLPGTHREGPVTHIHDWDCHIPDARVEVARDVIVPLAPGGALFFSSLLHHGTPPNTGPDRRWALQFHYAAESAVKLDRREHAALYFEDGAYTGCRGKNGRPLSEIEP